jgi:hypothetical protein
MFPTNPCSSRISKGLDLLQAADALAPLLPDAEDALRIDGERGGVVELDPFAIRSPLKHSGKAFDAISCNRSG